MSNIFWPVYKNLENSVVDISFNIHVDDVQLDVYSSRIVDLILRAAAEIESLTKKLYADVSNKHTDGIKFDDVALNHISKLWNLDCKNVILSSANCFQNERILVPFSKNTPKTVGKKLTYSWNNAYQNLKHDRMNNLKYGSVRHLLSIMAALYLLNLYNQENTFFIGNDGSGANFSPNRGSDIFAIEVAKNGGSQPNGTLNPAKEIDMSVYFIRPTQDTHEKLTRSISDFNQHIGSLLMRHPKIQKYLNEVSVEDKRKHGNLAWDVLGQDEYMNVMRDATREKPIKVQMEYEVVLNKGQFKEKNYGLVL